ncbi:rhomboid-like protein [Streptomyces sp. NPDC048506]|uniref:rhomboid-like protein n=1 Tax=Streptomyces sp. NPDC048506 TaxID=3155028 RepID=UPI00343B4CA6
MGTTGGTQAERAPGERTPGRGAGPADPPALLPGVPRQRPAREAVARAEAAEPQPEREPQPESQLERESQPEPAPGPARPRPWRLLPTPTGTPFTFGYAALLAATSLFAEHADPGLVSELLRGSSTDVVHLAQAPLLVLVASALWIAGGLTSFYAVAFLFVLTALERRVGGLRTAAVFFGGHALATLATEVPVAFSVAAGQLPESSLHRLDYGISFGVMTCTGALAGVLPAWSRWPLLAGVGYLALTDLVAYADPMTDWGHLLSLTLGIAAWPLLRHWRAGRSGPPPLLGDLRHPGLRGVRTH